MLRELISIALSWVQETNATLTINSINFFTLSVFG